MLKSRSPIAAAEADLATLTKRGAGLEQRRDTAAATLATATSERRRLLTEIDDPSAADLAKTDRAVRDAKDAHDAALDALGEVDRRVDEVRATIDGLKAAAERERRADAMEAAAKAADTAIARIAKAAAEISSARADLAAAIPPEAVVCYVPPSNPQNFGLQYLTVVSLFDHEGRPVVDHLSPEQVATRIAGHLVSVALPNLAISRTEDAAMAACGAQPLRALAPLDGASAAQAIITNPMRASAAATRRAPEAV